MKKPIKMNPISVRFYPATIAAVDKAARADSRRSRSAMIEKLVSEWCREHGYLKQAK